MLSYAIENDLARLDAGTGFARQSSRRSVTAADGITIPDDLRFNILDVAKGA
jgi:hypothetical protein